MQREACCLGGQLAPAREAQHVLKLSVPGNTVSVFVLRQEGLGLHAVDLDCVVVIHDCQLPSTAAEIQAPMRRPEAVQDNTSQCVQGILGSLQSSKIRRL